MRAALAWICLFFLILPAALLPGSYPSDYADSPVKIEVGGGLGSGVYLGDGVVLTARHVIANETSITIKTDKGKTAPAHVVWENVEYDVAILQMDGVLPIKAASLACRDIRLGEALEAHGNPLGNEFVTTWGRVAKKPHELLPTWKSAAIADLTIAPGSSGGPVFDWWGRVIGLAVGGWPGTALAILVPSSVVCMLMDGQVTK